MTKVLIFGDAGRVGKKLITAFLAADYEVCISTRADTDLSNGAAIIGTIHDHLPDVIINASACNGIEACADDPHSAYSINMLAPLAMAVAAKNLGAMLVHYSTDYVFSDSLKPLDESSYPSPASTYGASKLAGERVIYETDPYHLVFRLSSVYSDDLGGVLDVIKQIEHGRGTVDDPIKVLKQLCTPISARMVARQTLHAVTSVLASGMLRVNSGTFHMSPGSGAWKTDIAAAVAQIYAPGKKLYITEGKLREPRPICLPMDGSKFCARFGVEPWNPLDDIRETLAEIMAVPEGVAKQ